MRPKVDENTTISSQTTPCCVCNSTEDSLLSSRLSSLLVKAHLSITSFQREKARRESLRREGQSERAGQGLAPRNARSVDASITTWQTSGECISQQGGSDELRRPTFHSHPSLVGVEADVWEGVFLSTEPGEVTTDLLTVESKKNSNNSGSCRLSSFVLDETVAERGEGTPHGNGGALNVMHRRSKQPSLHTLRRKAAALFKDAVRQGMLQGELQDAVRNQIETRLYEAPSPLKKLEDELRECTFTPKINPRKEKSDSTPWWERLHGEKKSHQRQREKTSNGSNDWGGNQRASATGCVGNQNTTLKVHSNNLYLRSGGSIKGPTSSKHRVTWITSPTSAKHALNARQSSTTIPTQPPRPRRLERMLNSNEREAAQILLKSYLGSETDLWIIQ